MDRPRLRRLLLGLLAETPAPEAPYRGLSAREWLELDRIAGLHGLRPVLQFKSDALDWRDTIPLTIRQGWQHGQRVAAMQALVQRRDLLEIRDILARAGIMRPVALKGAFLAWHAYAQPALRPMGDLDLLIEVEQALSAFEALKSAGYTQLKPFELSPTATVRLLKHLPPLASPQGTMVELHMRCWPEPTAQNPGPPPRDAWMRQRARQWGDDDPVLYPENDDMLIHLVVHGAYDFRLNCGPRALLDCVAMADRFPPDWDAFWRMGHDEGWENGTALLFALADMWIRPGLLESCHCPLVVPNDVLNGAPDLLLQEPSHSTAAQALADMRRAIAQGSFLTAVRSRMAGEGIGGPQAPRNLAGHGGRAKWLAGKAQALLGALASGETRSCAAGMNSLRGWLTSPAANGRDSPAPPPGL